MPSEGLTANRLPRTARILTRRRSAVNRGGFGIWNLIFPVHLTCELRPENKAKLPLYTTACQKLLIFLDFWRVFAKTYCVKELFARRLGKIPPYLFADLDRMKAQTRGDIIDFGVGDPDQPTPQPIIRAMNRALADPARHHYPSYEGMLAARTAAADWYRRRFHVKLDPATEVCMLLGSKEGVGHLIWGITGPSDVVAIPDPSYMIYKHQALFAGARPLMLPLREKNDFLVDFCDIRDWSRIKLMILNYPANPTAGTAPPAFYREAVRLAHKHDFCLVNDNVYSELYFGSRPSSLLEVPGARERCVEFHSLSKTYNMTGWRIGFVVGNQHIIKALL
jgi:LL-diaminopimelate aminotransferase